MRTAIFVCAALLLMSVTAWADVPPYMSYQGVISDSSGDPVPDGYYDITFGLYTVETGGTADWEETQTLSVEGGIVNALLGSVVPLGDLRELLRGGDRPLPNLGLTRCPGDHLCQRVKVSHP